MSVLFPQLSLWLLIIVAAINFTLSAFVFSSNPKSSTNKIFAFLGVIITFWLVNMYLSLQNYSPQISIWLIRLSVFFASGINGLFVLLANVMPDEKISLKKEKLLTLLISTLTVMFLCLSNLIFKTVNVGANGGASPVPGMLIFIFPLFIVTTSIACFYVFIRRISGSDENVRKKLSVVFVGILLMLLFVVVTIVIPVTVRQNSYFVQFFPLYTLFFTGLTAYAIIKHNLFSVKVFATQAITIVIWIVLLAKLFVTKNSYEFFLDAVVFLVMVVFGVVLIKSVIVEIEQRKKLEELTQKLKDLDQQKNEFISMAAHELRAPMTAIKGYISMILEGDTGDIPEKARGFLADATSINDRMVRLVNNMLNVSRIEEGRMSFQFDTDELSRVVRTVYSQFLPEAQRKSLEYKLDISKEIKDRVYADIDKLHEIAGNLISNAIKYTETGSVIVRLVQKDAGTIRFEVVDTGPGISSEEQVKLFQKFYRVESNVGKTTGTGLGLYISRLMIEKFNGKIGLDSEPGKGSIFWFELPVVA